MEILSLIIGSGGLIGIFYVIFKMGKLVSSFEGSFKLIEERFKHIEERFKHLDEKFERIEKKVDTIASDIKNLTSRVDRLEVRLEERTLRVVHVQKNYPVQDEIKEN